MNLRVLGSVEVDLDSTPVAVRGQQLVVLVALTVAADRVVPLSTLVDYSWPVNPPKAARNCVQTVVKRLRQRLGADLIETIGTGYVLRTTGEVVDLLRFRELVAAAAGAASRHDTEGELRELGRALKLWRGDPLTGVPSDRLRQDWSSTLLEEWFSVIERRLDLDMERGHHRQVLPELRSLHAVYPLRESLTRRLMIALHQGGRRADALAVFRTAQARSRAELGLDLGRELAHLHQSFLAGGRELHAVGRGDGGSRLDDERIAAGADSPAARPKSSDRTATAAAGDGRRAVVPAQLPPDVGGFVGRETQLEHLDRLLPAAAETPSTAVVISAIAGTGGVGKTALALHWAHRVRDRFPDGHLYVNLSGYGPEKPVEPLDALAGFLRGMGLTDTEIPAGLAERAARFRTSIDGRKMLVLLDNAATVEQVRPLLPGSSTCFVIVTSRDALPGLVARHGALRVDVDLLSRQEAVALLRTSVGNRVDTEEAAATALVERCARLPLAIRVAAELVISRPGATLAELVDELGDERMFLDLLDAGGDPLSSARVVFSWSYQQLGDSVARGFRSIGQHPGRDLDSHAVAALADVDLAEARRIIDTLSRAHLVERAPGGRFHLHDLLRTYAAELAFTHHTMAEQRAALTRLFDYYLRTAAAAMDVISPHERHRRPTIPNPEGATAPFASHERALEWLEEERQNLMTIAASAATHGFPLHVVHLSAVLRRYLTSRGHHHDGLVLHTRALDVARALPGPGQGLPRGRALYGLGVTYERLGRYDEAISHYRQARATCDDGDDATRVFQGYVLNSAAIVYDRLGDFDEAFQHYQAALDLGRETDDDVLMAHVLNNVGILHAESGHHEKALEHYRQCLKIAQRVGMRELVGHVFDNLGNVYAKLGRHQKARQHLMRALDVARGERDREMETSVFNSLGQTTLAANDLPEALEYHRRALDLSRETGVRVEEARAHNGMARAHRDLGQLASARDHADQALQLYTDLGVPEAGQMRDLLGTLARP